MNKKEDQAKTLEPGLGGMRGRRKTLVGFGQLMGLQDVDVPKVKTSSSDSPSNSSHSDCSGSKSNVCSSEIEYQLHNVEENEKFRERLTGEIISHNYYCEVLFDSLEIIYRNVV